MIEIITPVVVVADLLFVLALGVDDEFRDEVEENVTEEVPGEGELNPVVSVFQDVQDIT